MRNMSGTLRAVALGALMAGAVGCASTYYAALETFGIEKREILVDRIENAQESQETAKDQFASALDRYRAVVNVEGGELEEVYDRLNSEFERSQSAAEDVSDRIGAVRNVAEDLFEEWGDEIEEYSDPDLARRSQRLLADTRGRYRELMGAMERAERSMEPVLTLFNDQVLFLRHNLNARAIGSLQSELAEIEAATDSLIDEMERAIREATSFIESMA